MKCTCLQSTRFSKNSQFPNVLLLFRFNLAATLELGQTLALSLLEGFLLRRSHSRALPNDVGTRRVSLGIVGPDHGSFVPHFLRRIPHDSVVKGFVHRWRDLRNDGGRRCCHTELVPIERFAINATFYVELEKNSEMRAINAFPLLRPWSLTYRKLLLRDVVCFVKRAFHVLEILVVLAALGQMRLHPELHYLVRPVVRTLH